MPTPPLTNWSTESLRILVVMTHPHDFMHCAATCGIHVQRGDTVMVVSMTDGAEAHIERLYDELIKPEAQRDPAVLSQTRDQYARQKPEAMFLSQGHSDAFARRRVELHAGRNGWMAGMSHAESFVRAGAEVFNHLPVPASAPRKASEGRMQMMSRIAGEKTR